MNTDAESLNAKHSAGGYTRIQLENPGRIDGVADRCLEIAYRGGPRPHANFPEERLLPTSPEL